MSENESEQEPSIEEILSSIRQIIADDDDDEPEVALEEAEPEAEPEPEPEPEPEVELEAAPEPEEEEIIDLTDKVDDEPEIDMADPFGDLLDDPDEEESLMSDDTLSKAVDSFARLASYVPVDRRNTSTLEDLVRDMLKPMLKGWLDDNLPDLVERLVREELERIARQARDD